MLPDEIAIDLDAFDRITSNEPHNLKDDASRARAMEIDHANFTNLRKGESLPGNKFIARTLGLGIPFSAVFYPRAKQEA